MRCVTSVNDKWVFIVGGIRNARITTGFSSQVSRHLHETGRRTSSRATVFCVKRSRARSLPFLNAGFLLQYLEGSFFYTWNIGSEAGIITAKCSVFWPHLPYHFTFPRWLTKCSMARVFWATASESFDIALWHHPRGRPRYLGTLTWSRCMRWMHRDRPPWRSLRAPLN